MCTVLNWIRCPPRLRHTRNRCHRFHLKIPGARLGRSKTSLLTRHKPSLLISWEEAEGEDQTLRRGDIRRSRHIRYWVLLRIEGCQLGPGDFLISESPLS